MIIHPFLFIDSYDIHGVSLCPQWNFETTGWVQKAVENCFVIVWPVGTNDPSLSFLSCWALDGGFPVTDKADEYAKSSMMDDTADYEVGTEYETRECCCNIGQSEPKDSSVFDDLTFLRNIAAVVVDTVAEQSEGAVTIDTKRIYMGGHSNGCTASLAMAAVHSDMVAAVCCHSPALVTPFPSDGSYSEQAVPMWFAHGKNDGTVNYYGSFNGGNNYIPGAKQTSELLGSVNNCKREEVTNLVEGNQAYSNIVHLDCDNNDARVELMALETAGHTPYMNADLFLGDPDYAEVTAVDTTQRAWEFCSRYARADSPVLQLVKPERSDGDQGSTPAMEEEDNKTTTQDRIDAWKAENSGVSSSSSTIGISSLFAAYAMTALSSFFLSLVC